MRYSFIGKNFDVTDNFSNKISAKLDRISKLFPKDIITKAATKTFEVVTICIKTILLSLWCILRVNRSSFTKKQNTYHGVLEQ